MPVHIASDGGPTFDLDVASTGIRISEEGTAAIATIRGARSAALAPETEEQTEIRTVHDLVAVQIRHESFTGESEFSEQGAEILATHRSGPVEVARAGRRALIRHRVAVVVGRGGA